MFQSIFNTLYAVFMHIKNVCHRSHSRIDHNGTHSHTHTQNEQKMENNFLCWFIGDFFLCRHWQPQCAAAFSRIHHVSFLFFISVFSLFLAMCRVPVTTIKFMKLFNHFRHWICAPHSIFHLTVNVSTPNGLRVWIWRIFRQMCAINGGTHRFFFRLSFIQHNDTVFHHKNFDVCKSLKSMNFDQHFDTSIQRFSFVFCDIKNDSLSYRIILLCSSFFFIPKQRIHCRYTVQFILPGHVCSSATQNV